MSPFLSPTSILESSRWALALAGDLPRPPWVCSYPHTPWVCPGKDQTILLVSGGGCNMQEPRVLSWICHFCRKWVDGIQRSKRMKIFVVECHFCLLWPALTSTLSPHTLSDLSLFKQTPSSEKSRSSSLKDHPSAARGCQVLHPFILSHRGQ